MGGVLAGVGNKPESQAHLEAPTYYKNGSPGLCRGRAGVGGDPGKATRTHPVAPTR